MHRRALLLSFLLLVGCGSESSAPTATSDATTDSISLGDSGVGSDSAADTTKSDSGSSIDSSVADSGADSITIDASDAGDAMTADDFAALYAHTVCDDFDACCTAIGKTEDHAACLTRVQTLVSTVLDAAVSKGATLDASKVPACLAALKTDKGACADATIDDVALYAIEEACANVVQGPVAPGGTCTTMTDCAQIDGAVTSCASYITGSTTTKICQRDFIGNVGDACESPPSSPAPSYHGCDSGKALVCDAATSKCVAYPSAGSPCLTSHAPSCDTADRCVGGTCAARVAIGGTCDASSDDCAPGARCDASTSKCVALGALGDACGDKSECASKECFSGKCDLHESGFGATSSCK